MTIPRGAPRDFFAFFFYALQSWPTTASSSVTTPTPCLCRVVSALVFLRCARYASSNANPTNRKQNVFFSRITVIVVAHSLLTPPSCRIHLAHHRVAFTPYPPSRRPHHHVDIPIGSPSPSYHPHHCVAIILTLVSPSPAALCRPHPHHRVALTLATVSPSPQPRTPHGRAILRGTEARDKRAENVARKPARDGFRLCPSRKIRWWTVLTPFPRAVQRACLPMFVVRRGLRRCGPRAGQFANSCVASNRLLTFSLTGLSEWRVGRHISATQVCQEVIVRRRSRGRGACPPARPPVDVM